jgi:hypothetical protein
MYQTHSEEVARLLLLQLLLQLLSNDVDVLSVACARIRKLRDLLIDDRSDHTQSDRLPVSFRAPVVNPLPQLSTSNLGRSGVLHETTKRHASSTTEPGSRVHQCHCNVRPDPRHRDAALHTGR